MKKLYKKNLSIYNIWKSMIQRCENPHSRNFLYYGGRGIRVCRRWKTFTNFLADMGKRPPRKSIDRIDNDGNYEPDNCRWATRKEQSNNRSTTRRLTLNGQTRTLKEWAVYIGIHSSSLWWRLTKWPLKKALTLKGRRQRRNIY